MTSQSSSRARRRRVVTLALVGFVLLAAVGAGIAAWNALAHFTPAPAALQDRVDCLANAGWLIDGEATPAAVAALMGSLPKEFAPMDVVECKRDFVGPGTTTSPLQPTIVETHFAGDYAPLIAALEQPSDSAEGTANCTAQLEVTPDLWLVNAGGKAVHVLWPKDACGFSKPGVAAALAQLRISSSTTLAVPAAQ